MLEYFKQRQRALRGVIDHQSEIIKTSVEGTVIINTARRAVIDASIKLAEVMQAEDYFITSNRAQL